MIYNSFKFLILYPFIFIGYYLIPPNYQKTRNLFLLIVSFLLYINYKPVFAIVLLGVMVVTYLGGVILDGKWINGASLVLRRQMLWMFCFLGFLPLLFFKYFNFINESVYDILSLTGLRYELHGLNWAIPVGLSFYTFQSIGYLIDVYYKRFGAEKDFLTYALYISFFPSIIAGPINKASLMIPQLKSLRPYFNYSKAVEGMKMILWGMFMKVVVADRLGLYVDTVLPNYQNYTGSSCLLASFFYTIQIYADFGGYSLMAIGVGKSLGFEMTENFRRPYFAVSVTDFWHRWHISLSTWLRDYVYIPLGGSRCSKMRSCLNIFVTFLVSGIWHGANWTYIAWGMLHGFFLIIEKLFSRDDKDIWFLSKSTKIFITFMIVSFAWLFFRMPSLYDAIGVLLRIFNLSYSKSIYIDTVQTLPFVIMGVSLLLIKDIRDEFFPSKLKFMNNPSIVVRWITYLLLVVVILSSGVLSSDQYIYSNF